MLRFGLWIAGLSVVMAALTVGSMLWGRIQPNPVKLQTIGFDLCDRQPCLKGITPGITTWDEAWKLLAQKGAAVQDGEAEMTIGDIEVLAQETAIEKLNTVTLRVRDSSSGHNELPSLGYFVSKYGTPCNFILPDSTTGFPEAFVDYPYWDLIITVDNNRVEPSSPVETVEMFDWAGSDCPNIQDIGPSSSPVVPWLGFTSIDHYMMEAVQQDQ